MKKSTIHRILFVLGIALGIAFGFAARAYADTYTPPEFLSRPPALPASYAASRALRLDLHEALKIAMRQHLGLVVQRKEVEASELAVLEAKWGLYEPSVSSSIDFGSTPLWSASTGIALPTGGRIDIGAGGAFAGDGGAALSLSFTQPLLRGFSLDLMIPRYSILTARIASKKQQLALEISAAGVIEETESAYWDVVYALYSHEVTMKSRQLAADTVTLVERQVAAGMVSPSELANAKSRLAQTEVSVLRSTQSVEQSWDSLRTILVLPHDQWDRPLLPTDRPTFTPRAPTSAEAAYATALKHRADLAQTELSLEESALARRKEDNDALPQIDLGIHTSVEDPSASNGWTRATTGVISLSWTPFGKQRSLAKKQSRIRREIELTSKEAQLQGVWNGVRSAVRGDAASTQDLLAASQSRAAAVISLDLETKKYINGGSSNLDVANVQSSLASAELSELGALIAYERAQTTLYQATGQLLAQRHIDLQVVR